MSRRAVIIAASVAVASVAAGVRADSLWQRRSRERAFMFYDSPIYEVGDQLTVLIRQQTDVDNRETRSMSKRSKLSEKFSFAGSSSGGLADQAATADLDLNNEANREFDGDASFEAEQEFTDQIRVTVREVLPNGNLVVSGERRIGIDGDGRRLRVSGIVRRQDIAADGSVNSNLLAESIIEYVGRGPNQAFTRQGWLGRVMNRLWPF
jgi:flagellar L-ring protein precursor FlgH